MAIVTMKAGTLSQEMMHPLSIPQRVPISMPAMTAGATAAVYYKPDGGDSRESDYRTDTQVYATDDDDKSHAQAEADIAEHLTTDGQDVVLCQKNRREQGQSGHHYHKDGEDAQIRL